MRTVQGQDTPNFISEPISARVLIDLQACGNEPKGKIPFPTLLAYIFYAQKADVIIYGQLWGDKLVGWKCSRKKLARKATALEMAVRLVKLDNYKRLNIPDAESTSEVYDIAEDYLPAKSRHVRKTYFMERVVKLLATRLDIAIPVLKLNTKQWSQDGLLHFVGYWDESKRMKDLAGYCAGPTETIAKELIDELYKTPALLAACKEHR